MLLAYILNESILTGARGAGYQILYQTKWWSTRRVCWEGEDEATAPAGGMEKSTDAHGLHHIKRMGEQTTSHQVQMAANYLNISQGSS